MDDLSKIKLPIEKDLLEFKKMFDASLSNSNPLLTEVSSHVLQRSGKMMRPMLVLLFARLNAPVHDQTLFTAVSLELLHTASLIHDDVVDESKERRGQKSVNAIYDNRIAVLSGDYLLATALHYAAKTHNNLIINVVSQLGRDLSDGELLQLYNIGNLVFSEEDYYNVIRKKTAALFSACAMTGSLSVSPDADKADFARQLGEYMGICFQIRDDIFDYFNDDSIGKPTHNDMIEGKLTLPAIYALNSTTESWPHDIAVKVKKGLASVDEINRLASYAKECGGIEYAVQKMNEFHDKGMQMLDSVSDSDIKVSLIGYLNYIVNRDL
jgi:octaprenyl-diphosphate synthase